MRKIQLIILAVAAIFLGNMFSGILFEKQESELISPIPEQTPASNPAPVTSYVKDFRLKAVTELLRDVDSPLQSEVLVDCAERNQVDPYVLVGISRIESTFGKRACDGNPFGWSSCRIPFTTLEESCQAVASGIANLSYYEKYQGSSDIQDLGEVYCPPSSGCNTDHWINTVISTKNELQERELILSIEELATLVPSNKSAKELEINTLALRSHLETSSGITKEVIEILIKANEKSLANTEYDL